MASPHHRNRTLWLCTFLHLFTHAYQLALVPLYLLLRKDFGLKSDAEAPFLVTAMGAAYFLLAYFQGMLADRFSRKRLLALGLAINAIAFIGLSFSSSFGWAIGWVILAGLGGSFF